MPQPHDTEDAPIVVPKPMIIGAGLLIFCVIGLAIFARFTGAGRIARPASSVVAERDVIFQQLPGGVVRVLDAESRRVIISFPDGQGGMIRGSLRAFAYTRKVRGVELDGAPFRLTAWENGSLSLDDPSTDSRVELDAFGSENRAAFASLLRK
jgi:putative photosynthetic complex assembly protein